MAPSSWRWTWLGALSLFILAAATGALLRFGLLSGFPWGLQYTNVRHAHSHLMYFGWVTPALMGMMVAWLPTLTERPFSRSLQRRFRAIIFNTLLLALAAYVPFLLYGYRLAEIGSARLPLSTIAASANMLAWYAFGLTYWQATKGAARVKPLRLWDAALIFMVLASSGAWGVAVAAALNLSNPILAAALARIFLDLFAEGWFVLGLLGLAYAANPSAIGHRWAAPSETLLIMGLPVIFLLGMPVTLLPAPARLIGSLGGLMVGIGLLGHLVALWGATERRWRPALFFLGLKATATLAITAPVIALWTDRALLRVSYLHWLLLGFITLGLAAAAQAMWGRKFIRGFWALTAVATLLILSLIPLTTLWPTAWQGRWTREFAAWAALGPVIVASGMLLWSGWKSNREVETGE